VSQFGLSPMKRYTIKRSAGSPSVEPVSLDEAKLWLKVDDDVTEDDDLISSLIQSAREAIEIWIARTLVTTTWGLYLDDFPPSGSPIGVPRPPLQGVSLVKYYDTDGNIQAWGSSNYHVDTVQSPGRIVRVYGQTYPDVQLGRPNAVEITFTAGYGDAGSDVPEPIRTALQMVVADNYEHREAQTEIKIETNDAVRRLLNPYRVIVLK